MVAAKIHRDSDSGLKKHSDHAADPR